MGGITIIGGGIKALTNAILDKTSLQFKQRRREGVEEKILGDTCLKYAVYDCPSEIGKGWGAGPGLRKEGGFPF